MKKALVAAVLALGLFSSCLGPDRLFNRLHDWNLKATENRWGNEAIFLGLTIIPVYAVTYAIDIIILNSIEWWSGDNPMD
jgi:uncharacterized protein DUF3332